MKHGIRHAAIAILLLIPLCGISQKIIVPHYEAGFTFSQFPSKDLSVTWQISDSTDIRKNPLIGPLIGISFSSHLSKKFLLIYGLNYQISGSKVYSYSHWTDPHIYPGAYYKYWQTVRIHSITIPFSLGYEFDFKVIKPVIFIGLKPNLLLSAKMSEKSYHSDWTEDVKTTTNLFRKTTDYQPPRRIINQVSFGILTPIGSNAAINVSYNLGHNYYSTTYYSHTGMRSVTPVKFKTSIKSSNFQVSLRFNFSKKK